MKGSHEILFLGTPVEVALRQFLRHHRLAVPLGDLETFERELHSHIAALESELVSEEVARYDVDAPEVMFDGRKFVRGQVASESYTSGAGPFKATRRLYHAADGSGETICPLELRSGMVEGAWTPRAARLMAMFVAQMPASEAEKFFTELGSMAPSRSSLERLPKALSARWEANRLTWEAALRDQQRLPENVAVIANALDGVLAPMKDGKRAEKRMTSEKHLKGPAGYREAAVATVSLYSREDTDEGPERLATIRFGRMPESKKVTLHGQLAAEYAAVRATLPLAQVVNIADGAKENWRILRQVAPGGIEIVDFFHAAEHLKRGLDADLGEGTADAKAYFAGYRESLRDDDDGVERVIRTLVYRAKKATGTKAKKIKAEVTYFRNHRNQMHYAEYKRKGLPIGSGVVEATCKTLVTHRMKRSGMRWAIPGGQAILTLRGLLQSDRWAQGWALIAASYVKTVEAVEKISGERPGEAHAA
jgi:hypothetical protein